jgi:lipid-A-disaccharide synthase
VKIAVVAGEASGDLHAAGVISELRKLDPALDVFGIGGDLLARQGARLVHHAREMGIVGLFNVLRHYPMFRRIFNDMVAALARERPDVVLLVDYPGFNLRIARKCRELGLRVVYFISPQLWAWRSGRVRAIARTVDRMLVILPFEEEFYRGHGVPVTYVGHPLIEQVGAVVRPPRKDGVTRIALLPGSRRMEVDALLPPMLDAVAILAAERNIEACVVQAPTIERARIEAILRERGSDVPVVTHDHGERIAASDLAFSASGTVTLECAIVGTPVIVMYRLTRATYWVAQRVVKVPHFSLVNIIAGRNVVPELIQHDVSGERIAAEARRMLDPAVYEGLRADLAEVRARLGEPGAGRRAAEAIMDVVNG